MLKQLRYNTNCKLFDAITGAMIINTRAEEIIRIYSERLTVDMLKFIKEYFWKYMMEYSVA